ncbi:M17 family peptidase N-terminal domain-containing protein, partial [Borreliella bavariensis]|uniref:M17 family peptidase N-terminal domain-containing protein n=1 Tax=Borreliella bavariensis TaxID=664662 RepID=UPI0031841581
MSAQFSLPATGLATQLELSKKLPEDIDALVVPTFKGEDGLELAASGLFDENLEIAIWDLLVAVGATGKQGEVVRIPSIEGSEVDFIVCVVSRDNDSLDYDTLRRAAGAVARGWSGGPLVTMT